MAVLGTLFEALAIALSMAWDTWWALVLGFTLTGAIGEFVTEAQMTRYLGDDGWPTIGLATVFGAASSSCSYSATSTTRVLVEKGASFAAALAFMFASTDLVLELGLVIWILLGWQFVAADIIGGILAVVVIATLFRRYVPDSWATAAREHAEALTETECAACGMRADPDDADTVEAMVDGGIHYFCCDGCLSAYEATTDSDDDAGPLSLDGWKRACTSAVREWDMLWTDIAIGFLIAGLLEAFVPRSFWMDLFSLGGSGGLSWILVSVVVATAVGVLTFLCSVGNVPFALVLWSNGVAFGGVLSFIYADLIIPPLVRAHKRYFGMRMAAVVFVVIFTAAVVAGVAIHFLFGLAGLIPPAGETGGTAPGGYTVVLNLLFTGLFLVQLYVTFGAQRLAMAALDGVGSVVTGLTVAAMAASFVAGGLETTETVVSEGADASESLADVVESVRDDLDAWVETSRKRVETWES